MDDLADRQLPEPGVDPTRGAAPDPPGDLRAWINRISRAGHLAVIDAPIRCDEEMGALTYMAAQREGAPALWFRNIVGYDPTYSVLFNLIGSSLPRLCIAFGLDPALTPTQLVDILRRRLGQRLPPVYVDGGLAPVNEHLLVGDAVDITRFPAPKMWPFDGGAYIGSADILLTRDPDRGHLNMACYRQMVHGPQAVGLYMSPGKDGRLAMERYHSQGRPMEVVAAWGVDPAMVVLASQAFSKLQSELDFAGGLLGRPVELTPGIATGLPLPARAEVVIEGVVEPGDLLPEGPFGEFSGYYGHPGGASPVIRIKAVHHRSNPILTAALMADYPACEMALFNGIFRSARVWNDLDALGVPGIRGVYCHPAAASGFGMTVVSLEQRYAGHASQVLALAAQVPGAAYFSKWCIAVDEDVDPSDLNQVAWAQATRCNPADDIDILRGTWSTTLDPTQFPLEQRPYASKALINACKSHRYLKEHPRRAEVRRSVYEALCRRWPEFGLPHTPPQLPSLLNE